MLRAREEAWRQREQDLERIERGVREPEFIKNEELKRAEELAKKMRKI